MQIGLKYARIVVYQQFLNYIEEHPELHNDKHRIFCLEVIDDVIKKIQHYLAENNDIQLKVTNTAVDEDEKIKDTVEKYFYIDDSYIITNSDEPNIVETFLYLYRVKTAKYSELTDHMYYAAIVNKVFRNNPNFIENNIHINEVALELSIHDLFDLYDEYSKICRNAYYKANKINNVIPQLKDLAARKNKLLKPLCIDDKSFKTIVEQRKTSQMFISVDSYITKLKKDAIEYRIMHNSKYKKPNDITGDDLILYFNIIISHRYYSNMVELINSGVLDRFPREKNYIIAQVSLEDSICESLFLENPQEITMSKEKRTSCREFPKTLIYELYQVPITNNINSIIGTTDEDYVKYNYTLASNMCSVLFLKAIASIDPELEDRINTSIKEAPNYNSEANKTSTKLIQNFMNIKEVCQSEIEKIKNLRKD